MKEVRKIISEEVRSYCIKNNLYTRGTNKEYEHLLFGLCNVKPATTAKVKKVAEDILAHSNWQKKADLMGVDYNEYLTYIMEDIINECSYTMIKDWEE